MWRSTAPTLTLNVRCDGHEHSLLWRNGSVELPDHPDLDAELALVAFGGAEPACITQLKMWENAVADGGFLAEWADDAALTPSWLSWLSMALERMRTEGFHEVLRSLPPDRSLRMGEFIEQFPLEWLDRAAAEVSEALDPDGLKASAGVVCTDAPRHLTDAIGVRLRRAFVRSIGSTYLTIGAAALVPLDIEVDSSPHSLTPSVEGTLGGSGRGVSLAVGPEWLHRVWAAGADTIDQRLVLDLTARSDRADTSSPTAVATLVSFGSSTDRSGGSATARIEHVPVTYDGTCWQRA